jgi:hypothetical protein
MRGDIMKCVILPCAILATMLALPAQAQSGRTFVSAAGSDSNNCINVASPCRHFAAAFAATASDGEIYVLDPANYGALTITHAVSIQGHGWGSIAPVSGGAAVTINAPATDAVNLDGLTIDGTGLISNGIVFNSGASLVVNDCIVRNVGGPGLQFISTATTTQKLAVSSSYFNDNGNAGIIIATQSSGAITASIDRTGFYSNVGPGLFVDGSNGTGALTVGVTDSVAANNAASSGSIGSGFIVHSAANQSVSNLSLTHALTEGNGFGVSAIGANATLWLAQSTMTGNGTGFSASSGGVINSYGDNYFATNGANSGSLTGVSKQ